MPNWTTTNTTIETWFERDRAHVELRDLAGNTIVEWWDRDVAQAVEDGLLPGGAFVLGRLRFPHMLHSAAVEHANEMGLAVTQAPIAANQIPGRRPHQGL